MPEKYEYTPEVLAVVCDVCHAAITGRCLEKTQLYGSKYRSTPHRERVWKAKGYTWFCDACVEMVPQDHIIIVSNEATKTGTCKTMREAAA